MVEYKGAKFFLWLFAICCSLMGVQFVYSIQFSLGTPLFQNEFRLKPSVIAIILATSGPISGFIVQPIVGVFSDRCRSKWGRRRPFILAGSIGCVIGMGLIGASVDLGILLGDIRASSDSGDHTWGLILAISGLMIMNIFVNTIQGPARAVVLDLVPDNKQQDGNAMVSGVMGISAIIANLVGVPMFSTDEPYRNLFYMGVGFVLVASLTTCIFAKEEQYQGDDEESVPIASQSTTDASVDAYDSVSLQAKKYSGVGGAFYQIFYTFRHIPKKMVIVVLAYFFSWCAYAPFMIYVTSFFSNNLYGGGDNVSQGIKMGMFGLAIFSAAQWLFSLVLAPFTRVIPVQCVYFITQAIATAAYGSFYFLQNIPDLKEAVALTFVVMAFVAVNFTTMNSLPFGLVRGITGNKNAGLYMGVLNAASVVAQTATNLASSLVLSLTEEEVEDSSSSGSDFSSSVSGISSSGTGTHIVQNVTNAIIFGGALSVFAAICSLFLRGETADDEKKKETQPAETSPLINERKEY